MVKEIPTSKGYFAIVDDDDYEWLSKYKWHYNKGYAQTYVKVHNGKKKHTGMHRLIMNPPEDKEVDHINGIKHDNRRVNLRIASKKENSRNVKKINPEGSTSQYKGLWFNQGNYKVTIYNNNKNEHIGTFTNEIAAANAYNYYAKKYFMEFAKLNDVPFMRKEEWENYRYKTTSNFKGVHWDKRRSVWVTSTYDKNNRRLQSYFYDEIIAANYYNHISNSLTNKCEYVSLQECEKLRITKATKSKYNGVTFDKKQNKWISGIRYKNKKYYLGRYDSEIEAALAYNKKAIELNINNLDRKLNKVTC